MSFRSDLAISSRRFFIVSGEVPHPITKTAMTAKHRKALRRDMTRNKLERIGGRNTGNEVMLGTGKKVPEGIGEILGQGCVNLQLFLYIDADTEPDGIVRRTVISGIGEDIIESLPGNGALLIAVGDLLLPAHTQHQPVIPYIALDSERNQSSPDGLAGFGVAHLVEGSRTIGILPGFQPGILIEQTLEAQPEKAAVQGHIHTQPEMQLGVFTPGGFEHAVVENRNQFAIDDFQSRKSPSLYEIGNLGIDRLRAIADP